MVLPPVPSVNVTAPPLSVASDTVIVLAPFRLIVPNPLTCDRLAVPAVARVSVLLPPPPVSVSPVSGEALTVTISFSAPPISVSAPVPNTMVSVLPPAPAAALITSFSGPPVNVSVPVPTT